jgi:exodeoxyribonuclease VII large subunit
VADVRAATPSVAAELAVPDKAEILNYILNTKKYLSQLINQKLDICSIKYENLCNSKLLKYPEKIIVDDRISILNQELNNLFEKVKTDIENKNNIFSKTVLKLDAISPLKILSRGYSVTEKDGEIVQGINDVDIGDNICVRLNKGKLNCSIISKEE